MIKVWITKTRAELFSEGSDEFPFFAACIREGVDYSEPRYFLTESELQSRDERIWNAAREEVREDDIVDGVLKGYYEELRYDNLSDYQAQQRKAEGGGG